MTTPLEYKNAYSEPGLALCLKYSDEPEKLKELIDHVKVEYALDGISPYFQEDEKEKRQVLRVRITRNKTVIEFTFGMSIHDTEILTSRPARHDEHPMTPGLYDTKDSAKVKAERQKIWDDLLYDLLCRCRLDAYCPKSFREFCLEYGYNEDSRKAEKMHRECLEQSAKIDRIFRQEELNYLPS